MIALPARLSSTHHTAVAVLLALGVLAGILVSVALDGGHEDARAQDIGDTRVAELPATPKEMEKRGAEAITVLAPADARSRNALVPFDPRNGEKAQPFRFRGTDQDRARALECLATATLYEAGDDAEGEASVAQVVLNRVRHPAFPATICGVVYQGSERQTGCQFTFTCDGSLSRRMSDAAWERARNVANRALSGYVEPTVGLATHYHTDWVYPYWSPSLRKLARVGTHLFFGWKGSWGGPAAFSVVYRGNEGRAVSLPGIIENADPETASIEPTDASGQKILGLPQPKAQLPRDMGKVPLYGNRLRLVGSDGHSFGLLAPPGTQASQLVNAALALCAQSGPCRVNAWSNEDDIPAAYPLPPATRTTMVFEYLREGRGGSGTTKFDCSRFPNKDPRACLATSGEFPEILKGVRFKN